MKVIKLFCADALTWIQRKLARLYRPGAPVSLSLDRLDFVEKNAGFWQHYFNDDQRSESGGYVLVPVERHPVVYLCDASFASIVAQARNLKLLFISSSSDNSVSTDILKSYPNSSIVYLNTWRYVVMKGTALVEAADAYCRIKTPQELLKFQVDGIRFGDAIYDTVLARGYATVDAVDRRVLRVLKQFYFLRAAIKHSITRYDIHTSVFAHTIGLQGTIFSRYLLQHGIEVLNRLGSHQILVKKYRTLQDIGVYPKKAEPKYFRMMMDMDDGTILRLAEEYLERRFTQQVKHPALDLAFSRMKKTFIDRQSFCTEYNLDDTRPIIFVMLHAFNDFPHSHFAKPMIFQDYYHWFIRTLEIADSVKSANWIFKEHPANEYYRTKDLSLKATFEQVTSEHIRFLDSGANFNARSVRYLADALITCIGTAGLEYSTCGIPCILGGESGYSGFGFTIEPKNAEEYEDCLKQIDKLQPLHQKQVKAAKMVAYFTFCVMENAKYYFCPYFDDKEISEWNTVHEFRLWREAAAQFVNEQHVKKMRKQVRELAHFVSDNSWTQYVDLRQFPFLDGKEAFRGAIGPLGSSASTVNDL